MVIAVRLLVELSRDVVERLVQAVAQALHCSDGSDGDQSGDEAVLDCGCALGILEKLADRLHSGLHGWIASVSPGWTGQAGSARGQIEVVS